MKYTNIVNAKFISRPNRFIAEVDIDGKRESVHVKNTGRCRELLIPDAQVVLSISDNPLRKTKYDLIAVKKEELGWVNIDSQAPNTVVREWLEIEPSVTYIKPEYVYGESRIDFYAEREETRILMEVKGCTLEIDGVGYFPDAPTERGIKHLKELINAVHEGYDCYLAFVIAMPHVAVVKPNNMTHPAFGEALEEAVKNGVKILYLACDVTPDTLTVKNDCKLP